MRKFTTRIPASLAFSAAASVHLFRNQIGLIRGNLQLLGSLDELANDETRRREIINKKNKPVTMLVVVNY